MTTNPPQSNEPIIIEVHPGGLSFDYDETDPELFNTSRIAQQPAFYRNTQILSQIKLSRFEDQRLFEFMNTHFSPTTPVIADELRRYALVDLLKRVFKNANLVDEVNRLESDKDNKPELCEFLNEISQFISFFSNFSTKSKAVLQFAPSDVAKHINDKALTGAISILSIGGLAALGNSAVRAKLGGLGVLGGISYLAIDKLLGDSKTKDKLMAFSDKIINFYDIPSQTPAPILNACFLPFFTEASLSQVTISEMREFVTSKGKRNYNKIVNRSLILKSVFGTLPLEHKELFFDTLKTILFKTVGENPNPLMKESETFYSARLFLFFKQNILSLVLPETKANVTSPLLVDAEVTPVITDEPGSLTEHFPPSFSTMNKVSKNITLAPTPLGNLRSRFRYKLGSNQSADIDGSGLVANTLAVETEIHHIYHDLLGNAIVPVNLPSGSYDSNKLVELRDKVIGAFARNSMDVSSDLKFLGINSTDGSSDSVLFFKVDNLIQSPNIYNLSTALSVKPIKNYRSISTLEEGLFESYTTNPAERILLKMAGINSLAPSVLSAQGNTPSATWPSDLAESTSTLQTHCHALRNRVKESLDNESLYPPETSRMFQLLSLLLKKTFSLAQHDSVKIGNILNDLQNYSRLSYMVSAVIDYNVSLFNDNFKQEHRVENGPVDLFVELENHDRHLAALLAHAYAYPEDRSNIVPSSVANANTYSSYVAYFNQVRSNVMEYNSHAEIYSRPEFTTIQQIQLRNLFTSLKLSQIESTNVQPGQFLFCNQLTGSTVLSEVSIPTHLQLPAGYKLYKNNTDTAVNIPGSVTEPCAVLRKN